MRFWSRLLASLRVLTALPLFVQPLAVCALIDCTNPQRMPRDTLVSRQCVDDTNESCCPADDRSCSPDSQHCILLTAPQADLARPAAVAHAPELALSRIPSTQPTLNDLARNRIGDHPSANRLPHSQFDPIVAQAPRAPPPGISPSDWI